MRRALVFALGLCAARLAAAEGEWTRTAEATVGSRYVRRGVERTGASVQPTVRVSDDTWSLGAWINCPLRDVRWNELGMAVGYMHAFDGGLTLGIEVAHYHFDEANDGHPAHTAEVTATASLPLGPGRLGARVGRDVSRRADLGEVAYVGEYALKTWGAFLHYRAYVGSVAAGDALPERPSPRIEDSYTYHGLDLTLPYRVGGQTVLTAGLHCAGTNGARAFWSPNKASSRGKFWVSFAASREF